MVFIRNKRPRKLKLRQKVVFLLKNRIFANSKAAGGTAPGVISRGFRGSSPLAKITDHFGGLNPHKFLYWLCFSKCVDLAFSLL